MTGELKDDITVPSLPIVCHTSGAEDVTACIDLPTRLHDADVVRGKTYWKGRIIGGKVLDRSYSAEKASFTEIGPSKQIVVDGTLCSSAYVDEKGNCLFDRAHDMQIDSSSSSSSSSKSKSSSNSSSSSSADTTSGEQSSSPSDDSTSKVGEDDRECPVCKYMKAGPCREQFEKWDNCVQGLTDAEDLAKCFDITVSMMECMRSHEYYDMMTAGTEEKFEAAQNAANPNKAPL
jgi:hypothetical protein